MIKKSTTEARPSPKNEVWEQEIEGQKYICERPYYFIKKLERELYSKCFENESQLIYGKNPWRTGKRRHHSWFKYG